MSIVFRFHRFYSKKLRKNNQSKSYQFYSIVYLFSYTLVLTYNLWRNYPLSAFFEYIFLFIQGRR